MRKRRLFVAVLLAAVAAAAAFLALLLRPAGDAAGIKRDGQRIELIAAAKRKALPDLTAPTLTPPPARISLRALRGRPTFLGVWASWCVPCREEAPTLARLWRQYRDRVRFVGIDIEDTRSEARAFARRYGLGYVQIFDVKASLAGKLGFFGLPTAFFVDRHGRIAARLVGRQKEETLRAALEQLDREAKADM
jgi:thiol-disulfide isomerase/thioredoxin